LLEGIKDFWLLEPNNDFIQTESILTNAYNQGKQVKDLKLEKSKLKSIRLYPGDFLFIP
jgi:hypothetical protein